MKRLKVIVLWILIISLALSIISFSYTNTIWSLKYYNLLRYDSIFIRSVTDINFKIKSENEYENVLKFEESKSKLLLYVNSQTERYCYFTADVTALYYFDSEETPVKNLNILTTKPSRFIESDVNWNENEYIFPGRYDQDKLPEELYNKRLIGYYPFDCKESGNVELLKDIAIFYREFDPVYERAYLEDEIKKLQ
jgi:hypothetical protein